MWFWATWNLWFVSGKMSGLWSELGLRLRGKYGLNRGVFIHNKRFGSESWLGPWDGFVRFWSDDMGLGDVGDIVEALVAGVRQGTKVKSSSCDCPPYLPSLNLHLSSHGFQQHL